MYLLIRLLKKYMIVTTIADMAQCYVLVDVCFSIMKLK